MKYISLESKTPWVKRFNVIRGNTQYEVFISDSLTLIKRDGEIVKEMVVGIEEGEKLAKLLIENYKL